MHGRSADTGLAEIHEISELFDKQVNAQKEKLSGLTPAPASPRKKCAMKMKEKKRRAPKIFLMEGRSL